MNDFAESLAAERRAAVRLLLTEPLVTAASHPDEFPLVRRHADELARQFGQLLGYRLTVEPGFARLHKAGLGRDSGRRLERGSGAPFTPRTYAYLTLALAALVTAPEQLLLSEVVARTRAAAAEADIDLGEPNRVTERRALVAALKQLMAWRVIAEDEGSVDSYAGDVEADALLTIDREIARRLVSGPLSQAATPLDLIERSAETQQGPRHRVRRLLVETPVVYLDDLTEEELDWLRRSQRREQRILEDFTGLTAEIRAEGVALVDPEQELTDTQFPGTGTVAWAALLLVGRLAAELAPADAKTGVPIPEGRVEDLLGALIEEHGKAWSTELTASPTLLAAAVIDLLRRMRLVRPVVTDAAQPPQTGWLLSAAAARYAPEVST
ncbi:MAG: TIGR02678 family protein [Streptosporangiaceae bacterium]